MKTNILSLLFITLFSAASYGQVDRSVVPKPQPNPAINISIPEVQTADNGLKVIVVENHKLPKVSFQLFVDYPIEQEGNKAGVSEIFGQMLGSGTSSNSKDEFDAKVDYMGASINTNSRGFFASSLKKHTPKLLALLSEVIMSPAFPQEEFDRIINQSISALASEKSDPNSMAANVASIVNYGKDHPYGEITTEKTLGNITLDDVKDHYKKYFIPNQAYLVIVGDVTQKEANEYVNTYFSKWQKGTPNTQEKFETPKYEGNNVFFVDKPGAVQSRITLTHTVKLPPGHEDVITLRLLNQILGGGSFSAHLMQNLREDKAYTYGCYSSLDSDQLIGSFSAGGSFRNEVTDSAVVQILKEIEWMCNNLVSDSELELVKNSMTGAFARSLEQPQTMANFALNTVRYNLPTDYYTTYLTRLEKITKEEILAAAKKYLQPSNLNIIVVGNQEVSEKLTVFDSKGQVAYKDSYGNEQQQLKSVGEGVSLQSIFTKYVYKRFSVSNKEEYDAKMSKIGFIQTTYSVFIEDFGATMIITSYSGAPNKSASIVKIESGQGNMIAQKDWFNGESGAKFVAMQGKTTYEGDDLESKKINNFPLGQMNCLNNPYMVIELLGIEEIEGVEYYKVKVEKVGTQDFSYEFYNVQTGWLEMIESFETDAEGNTVSGKVVFSDYQEVKKGFMAPNKMTLYNPGAPAMEMELQKTTLKKKAKSSAFEGEF